MTDSRERPGAPGPDDRDLEDGGLDLSPRTGGPASGRPSGNRRWGAIAVLVVLVAAGAFIATRFLGESTLYYKNADEAVAEQDSLGTKNFRLQGTVVGTPEKGDGSQPSRFTVAYNDVEVKVVHTGSEPALFKAGLPVVVEGRWNADGTAFDSSRLLVKHTEDYKEQDDGNYVDENPDRVDPDQAAP